MVEDYWVAVGAAVGAVAGALFVMYVVPVIAPQTRGALPPRGTGLATGAAAGRGLGVPRTEAERYARHTSVYGGL